MWVGSFRFNGAGHYTDHNTPKSYWEPLAYEVSLYLLGRYPNYKFREVWIED